MKKQRYIVEIEMPDGDMVSSEWLRELIQQDCDVEDDGRQKVFVKETSLPSNLDEAAQQDAIRAYAMPEDGNIDKVFKVQEARIFHEIGFKAGAEWMAGKG